MLFLLQPEVITAASMANSTTVSLSPLWLAIIGLAATLLPPLILYSLQAWAASRKEMRDSERKISEAKETARLQAEKEERDYKRQDEVADRATKVAEQAAAAAKLLVESQAAANVRQDAVAALVATAADKAAGAAELLATTQKAAIAKQDEVAALAAIAAKRVGEAADLLVTTQNAAIAKQDEVAALVAAAAKQAVDAAELLRLAQKETITRTDEVAATAAAQDKRVWEQLITIGEVGDATHILVNSDMTTARTNERDTLRMLVIALRQLLLLNKSTGVDQTKEEDEITRVEKRIEELTQILADRRAAQGIVDGEQKKNASRKSQEASSILDARIATPGPSVPLPLGVGTGEAQSKPAPVEVTIVNKPDSPVPVTDAPVKEK